MTRYEYKVIELKFTDEINEALTNNVLGNALTTNIREQINALVEKKLNELGKDGWLLHNSGLATLPTLLVYKTKGVNNVRQNRSNA